MTRNLPTLLRRNEPHLAIREAEIGTLKLGPRRLRRYAKRHIEKIRTSIKEFGFLTPVLVDHHDRVVAGVARVEALRSLDCKTVPVIRIDHLSEAQIRAFRIADNKLAEGADWDHEQLATEFREILNIEIEYDLELTGFETPEIDIIFSEFTPEGADEMLDDVPELQTSGPPVSSVGDLWQLGQNRLLCGDACCERNFKRLLAGGLAQMVITDPPYNVHIDGNVCGQGTIRHREFAMASGEMSRARYEAFLNASLTNMARFSRDGAITFVFMDWRHFGQLLQVAEPIYGELKNLCVWNKQNGGMGSLYRSQHELVAVFKKGSAEHINNIELGRHGRNRTNVWVHPGMSSLGKDRLDDLSMHPTVKPVRLIADAMLDCSKRNGVVLDPFAGSGTVFVAAEETDRVAYGMEIDPLYVDTAIRRWQRRTGSNAVNASTGLTFNETYAQLRKED